MAEEQRQTVLQRYFWFFAAAFVVLVVAAVVLLFRSSEAGKDDVEAELNENYVEEISVQTTPAGGSSSQLILIDGVKRFDCSADDGRLECSEDPQPTLESSGN